jgi:hypothetical protein
MFLYNLEVAVKISSQTHKLKRIEKASASILSQFQNLIKGASLEVA